MAADGNGNASVDVLDEWVAEAAGALGVEASRSDVSDILDLASRVAHGVVRPGAPVTAFLVGLAAGRAGGSRGDVEAALETVLALVERRAAAAEAGAGGAEGAGATPGEPASAGPAVASVERSDGLTVEADDAGTEATA